jgi:hypothetical protein
MHTYKTLQICLNFFSILSVKIFILKNCFKTRQFVVTFFFFFFCKLYWTVEQDIPNGTSANGTRSSMRGTLPFYKLIKLQKLLLRLLYYN